MKAETLPQPGAAQQLIQFCQALSLDAVPSRRALARRIELTVDPEMEAAYPKHYGARVHLELANGKSYDSAVLDPHGMPSDPCSDAERLAKFRLLVRDRIPEARAAQVIDAVNRIENVRSAGDLTRMMKPDQRDSAAA